MGLQAWAGRRLPRWWRWAALLLLCLAALLPGFASLPATDRDEARFAQATRQMVATDELVDIRFQDQTRYKKPIGIYWLQAAAVALAGPDRANPIWPYRLPSVLGALVAVLACFGFGRRLVGEEAAFLAAALLAVSVGLEVEARLAKTDAVLLATVTLAMGAFASLYRTVQDGGVPSRRLALTGWAALGVGVLVKGPIAPLVVALSVAVLAVVDRGQSQGRGFRRALCWPAGLAVALAIVLPWALAITIASDGAFWRDAIGQDLAPKLAGGVESHGGPPGYYLVTLWAMLWPGVLVLALAAPWIWHRRHDPGLRFLLAWAIPGFLLFEAVPTKLPHYTLPVFPALLLLATSQLTALSWPAETRAGRWWRRFGLAAFTLVTLGLAGALAGAAFYLAGPGLAGALVLAVAGVLVWAVWRLAAIPDPGRMIGALVAGGALVVGLGFAAILPGLAPLWPARGVAAILHRIDPAGAAPLVATGYTEPSLVFETRSDIRLIAPAEVAAAMRSDPGTIAIVEAGRRAAVEAALGTAAVDLLGHVSGLNLSRGKRVEIDLLRLAR